MVLSTRAALARRRRLAAFGSWLLRSAWGRAGRGVEGRCDRCAVRTDARGSRRGCRTLIRSLRPAKTGRRGGLGKTGWSADPSNRRALALEQPSKSGRRRMGAAKHQLPPRTGHARRAEPRESHDSPDPPLGSRRVRSPPSTATTPNPESRAHHRKSRPPRRPTTALGSPRDPTHEGRGTPRRLRRPNHKKTEPVNAAIIG